VTSSIEIPAGGEVDATTAYCIPTLSIEPTVGLDDDAQSNAGMPAPSACIRL